MIFGYIDKFEHITIHIRANAPEFISLLKQVIKLSEIAGKPYLLLLPNL